MFGLAVYCSLCYWWETHPGMSLAPSRGSLRNSRKPMAARHTILGQAFLQMSFVSVLFVHWLDLTFG